MKKFNTALLLTLFLSGLSVFADTKISDLPLGTAASVITLDSFPYVSTATGKTKRLKLSDLPNLPTMASTFAPLLSGTALTATLDPFSSTLKGLVPASGGGTTHFLRADGTWAVAGTGSVTSVGLTAPAFLTVSGSPVTNSGTLALSYSGTALPIANGGTGQTSASGAFNAFSPMTTGGDIIYGGASGVATRLANGSAGQILTSSGSTDAPTWTDGVASDSHNNTRVGSGISTVSNGFTENNSAVGKNALNALNGGSGNTALGAFSGYNTVAGNFNTAIGYTAMGPGAVPGDNNIAIGTGSLSQITSSGVQNVAIGTNALISVTSGGSNTAVGSLADVTSGALGHATALGAGAAVSTSNTVVLGRTTDATVIGATGDDSSGALLQVSGSAKATTFIGALTGNATTATTAGTISGTITESQVTNLVSDLALKAPLASPTFTGTVTIPNGSVLGTPSSMTATNIQGLASNLTAGAATNLIGSNVGSIPFQNGTNITAFRSIGSTGDVLTVSGGAPIWAAPTTLSGIAPLASPTFTGVVTLPTPFTLGATSVTSTGVQLNLLNSVSTSTGGFNTLVFASSPTLLTPTFTTSATTAKVIGGTGASSSLSLQSTSGTGGSTDYIKFLVGNAGATEAMYIGGNGAIGLGTTGVSPPGAAFDVRTGAIASTSAISSWGVGNAYDYTIAGNTEYLQMLHLGASGSYLTNGKSGTGSYRPMTLAAGGSSNLVLNTDQSSTFSGPIIGGTGTGSALTLESTSGVGATDAIVFKTGSQVEAGRVLTGGGLRLGGTTAQDTVTALFGTNKLTVIGGINSVNYNTNNALRFFRSGGTEAAPTSTTSGGTIGQLSTGGFDGTNWFSNATYRTFSAEAWTSSTNRGLYHAWSTIPIASGTAATTMLLNPSGFLGIGTGSSHTSVRTTLNIAQTTNSGVPALGTANDGFTLGASGNLYGLNMGVDPSGFSWMQAMRFDGTATGYNLHLQPSGGKVGIGMTPTNTLDVTGTFGATGAATLGSTLAVTGNVGIGIAPSNYLTVYHANNAAGSVNYQRLATDGISTNDSIWTQYYATGASVELGRMGLTSLGGGQMQWSVGNLYNGGVLSNTILALTNAGATVSVPLTSTVTTGTAPLVIASTTNVPNLNASLLSDMPSSFSADPLSIVARNGAGIVKNVADFVQLTSTATAAGTTTLTTSSNQIQVFTGATTQTVKLPTGTSTTAGVSYKIINLSSGSVTVQSSGANTISTLTANTAAWFTAINTNPTTAAHWTAL